MVWNPHILELDGYAQVAHLSARLRANNFMGRLWDEVINVVSGFQVGVLWAGRFWPSGDLVCAEDAWEFHAERLGREQRW